MIGIYALLVLMVVASFAAGMLVTRDLFQLASLDEKLAELEKEGDA